jgi:hypothetical protein
MSAPQRVRKKINASYEVQCTNIFTRKNFRENRLLHFIVAPTFEFQLILCKLTFRALTCKTRLKLRILFTY